jgi:hypothetical protein
MKSSRRKATAPVTGRPKSETIDVYGLLTRMHDALSIVTGIPALPGEDLAAHAARCTALTVEEFQKADWMASRGYGLAQIEERIYGNRLESVRRLSHGNAYGNVMIAVAEFMSKPTS